MFETVSQVSICSTRSRIEKGLNEDRPDAMWDCVNRFGYSIGFKLWMRHLDYS